MNATNAPAETGLTLLSDEDLAAQYRHTGDRGAVEVLIRRYAPRLRRLVIALVGPDEGTVLDAEQEVLITMVRKLPQFRSESRFSTFFYRLARNRVLDLLRSARRYQSRVTSLAEPDRSSGRMKSPEESLLDVERIATVRQAMQRLKPEDRLMLYLKDGEGQGIEELAALTGLAAGTVKSRLSRSRRRVAEALEDLGYEH